MKTRTPNPTLELLSPIDTVIEPVMVERQEIAMTELPLVQPSAKVVAQVPASTAGTLQLASPSPLAGSLAPATSPWLTPSPTPASTASKAADSGTSNTAR